MTRAELRQGCSSSRRHRGGLAPGKGGISSPLSWASPPSESSRASFSELLGCRASKTGPMKRLLGCALVVLAACGGDKTAPTPSTGASGSPTVSASPSPPPSQSSPSATGQPPAMAALCEHIHTGNQALSDFVNNAATVPESLHRIRTFQLQLQSLTPALRNAGLTALAAATERNATHLGQARVAILNGDSAAARAALRTATADVQQMIDAGLYCPNGV
jgi:hypothetical protein